MRVRIEGTEAAQHLPTDSDLYLFTVVLGLFIGIVLTWLGVKGQQIWLTVWSAGLILASIIYIVWVVWFE